MTKLELNFRGVCYNDEKCMGEIWYYEDNILFFGIKGDDKANRFLGSVYLEDDIDTEIVSIYCNANISDGKIDELLEKKQNFFK